jgi:hypothetical protein
MASHAAKMMQIQRQVMLLASKRSSELQEKYQNPFGQSNTERLLNLIDNSEEYGQKDSEYGMEGEED